LARSLPDYMVPSFFVYLDALPLTSNGKIDRKAFPEHNLYSSTTNIAIIYPETPLQFLLLNVWRRVLNIKTISIHDNFFRVSGNSLNAIKVVSFLNKDSSYKISVIDLFKNPTIYSLSRLIELDKGNFHNLPFIPIQTEGNGTPLFLIHPGGGLSFCYTGLSNFISDIRIYAINNPHFEDPEKGFATIEEMSSEYISLIKAIQKNGPYLLGGWSFGGIVAYEIAQQLTATKEEVAKVIVIDAGVPTEKQKTKNTHLNKEEKNQQEEDISKELYLKPMLESNLKFHEKLMLSYKCKKYEGNIVLIKASHINSEIKSSIPKDCGWSKFVKNVQIIETPGEHVTLFGKEYLSSTAKSIDLAIKSIKQNIIKKHK